MIFEWAKRLMGAFAYVIAPFMYLHQRILFGNKLDITAVDGINKSGVPVLLVHGSEDKTVRIDGSAIISCKEKITNSNVQYLLWEKENQNGHMDILYDAQNHERRSKVNEELMGKIVEFYESAE